MEHQNYHALASVSMPSCIACNRNDNTKMTMSPTSSRCNFAYVQSMPPFFVRSPITYHYTPGFVCWCMGQQWPKPNVWHRWMSWPVGGLLFTWTDENKKQIYCLLQPYNAWLQWQQMRIKIKYLCQGLLLPAFRTFYVWCRVWYEQDKFGYGTMLLFLVRCSK